MLKMSLSAPVPTPSKLCIICKADINGSEFNKLFNKGFNSLIALCNNHDLTDLGEELQRKHSLGFDVDVHVECRKNLLRNQGRNVKLSSDPPKKRSRTEGFNFKTQCFFCDKLVCLKNRHRDNLRFVSTIELRDNIKKIAHERNDNVSVKVLGRMEGLNQCSSTFFEVVHQGPHN